MIRFEKVTKMLGGFPVLKGVSLEVEKGEVFFIVGTSGAGKSVTLKHMVKLLTPDSGRIWVGKDLVSEAAGRDLARIRGRFGVLFQSGALMQWMNVQNNVALPLREHTDMSEEEMEKTVREKLALVGLEEALDKYPSDLSGGMRKRVALARAVIMNPEVVLYDEPTSGLDPVTSRTIDALIRKMSDELGVTSVVVTHDLHSALSIGNKIAMLDQGMIAEIASPEAFIQSKNEKVCSFLESQYITKTGEWERYSQS